MLLAYTYCYGPAALCIIPAKPDQFSCAVRVHSLIPTTDAVCRLSPSEGLKVFAEADPNVLVIEPMMPTKLYLTPSQHDRPGFSVQFARLKFGENNEVKIFYKVSDKDSDWKAWVPNESSVS